jgi:hypothetical protein
VSIRRRLRRGGLLLTPHGHFPPETFSCASTVDEPALRATTRALVRQAFTRIANEVANLPVALVFTVLVWLAAPAVAVTRIHMVRGNWRPTTVSGVTRVARRIGRVAACVPEALSSAAAATIGNSLRTPKV